ncbi:MAG: HAD family phosphatase [Rectinemataceae bacterium]
MHQFDAYIFDFGGVITLEPDRTRFTAIAGILGVDPADFLHAYAAERHEYDRGTLSAAMYWDRVAAHFGARIDPPDLERIIRLDMDAWFRINPAMVALLKELRPRTDRLLLLSNINFEGKTRLLGDARFCEGFDWTSLFDTMLFSCDLKLIKPERAIYDTCIAAAGVNAKRCVFVDDTTGNVTAAREAGMEAIVFTGEPELRMALGF